MKRQTRSKSKVQEKQRKSESKSASKKNKNKISDKYSDQHSKSKSPQSRRKSNQNAVAFEKGSFIAFVDPADNLEVFKIGQVVEDMRDVDEEIFVDVYEEMAPQQFKKQTQNLTVFSYCIICDVNAAVVEQGNRKKGQFIKITKQQENKVLKLMDGVVTKLQEREDEDDEGEEDEEDTESEEEESEDEDEESEEEQQKDTKEQILARKMLKIKKKGDNSGNKRNSKSPLIREKSEQKGKGKKVIQSQPARITRTRSKDPALKKKETKKQQEEKKVEVVEKEEKGSKSKSKKKESKSKTKVLETPKKNDSKKKEEKKSKKRGDIEMDQEEEEEEKKEEAKVSKKKQIVDEEMSQESLEQINTSKKRRHLKTPQLGVKRKRVMSAKKKQEDSEDEGDEQNEENLKSAKKKRKVAGGKEERVKKEKKEKKEKKPKQPRRPKEFKKGKWNPDVEIVDQDKYKWNPSKKPFFDCCIRCNNKNVIRAANTGDEDLLKECLNQKKKISLLTAFWSPEITFTALEIMVMNNNHEMLEILLHPKLKVPQFSNYDAERNNYYNDRIRNPQYLLNFVDSGMVSNMAYGTRVRRVQMTRGNRQGNNAFLQYNDNGNQNPWNYVCEQTFLQRIFYYDKVEVGTFRQLFKLNPNLENTLNSIVFEAVRAGNFEIAHEIIEKLVKYPNYGFNNLHAEVLSPDADELPKFVKASVTKKCNTNKDMTPLHCACINPNEKILKQLLDVSNEFSVADQDLRRPVHYAAACKGPGPLEVLIAAGANLFDLDNQKVNCLHIAAKTGRHLNIKVILENKPTLLNARDKKSMTPMAYACKYGHLEAVKMLIEFKVKINAGCGAERMPPLSWAATHGHYDLCEYLLEKKARVLSKDKFGRTPLIMAVRNGHTQIASLLLQRGSEWNHTDSSMNTPLHYASAYGWLDCMDLLLKTGADVNAGNSWKITPINIAMLKNHQGCVKRLLDEPNVDVNCKDEKGRTLLLLSLVALNEESFEFIKYLLVKGADPNIADLEGNASLHYIAKYNPRTILNNLNNQNFGGYNPIQSNKAQYEAQVEIQKKIAQLLISSNADLTTKNKLEETPFSICLSANNAPILQFLQNKVSLNKDPELLFAFSSKILNKEFQQILFKILENDPPTKEAINSLDQNGFTPFLSYVEAFTKQYNEILTTISNKINGQAYSLFGNNSININQIIEKLKNFDIFDPFADNQYNYNYNNNLNHADRTRAIQEIASREIVEPFIQVLKKLLEKGADCQAKVGKLKKYRDQEALSKEQFAQLQSDAQQLKEKKEEVVKKREEVLKGRILNRGYKKKAARKGFANNYNQFGNNQMTASAVNPAIVYDTRGGEKVERKYGPAGLRNAIHFIVSNPEKLVFDFLIKLGINPDEEDYDQTTPFNLASRQGVFRSADAVQQRAFDQLIELNVRIDYPDIKGRTAFLNFYEQSYLDIAYRMLDLGANVNQIDTSGLFAMKYALIRRQNNEIEKLLTRGGNINQIDNKGRNLLHHAVNMSSATADATFETEQFLIDRGVELNLRDYLGRTPLHYSFVKIKDWNRKDQIDPIETVSSLCGCKGLEMDVADKWLKTPLHYASQRGASISALYLINRKADPEKIDIYGNTPLGVGLLNGHYNYGIILIEKNLNVKIPIFQENHLLIAERWALEEKLKEKRKKGELKEVGMDIDEGKVLEQIKQEQLDKKKAKKNHRNLFNPNAQIYDVDDYGDEDNDYGDEDEDYDSDDQHQENVFNKQNAFGMNVYPAQQQQSLFMGNPFGNVLMLNNGNNGNTNAMNSISSNLVKNNEDTGVSMFKVAIRAQQQGLAYLILDKGYDLMLAMQDAMDEKKFLLVLTLLSKNPDDEIVQQNNPKGQNLFHILSMNAGGCSFEHLKRIYQTLLKRGVNCKAKDHFQRTALHYAVMSNSVQLVKMLLEECGEGTYNPNEVDVEGHTPLSLCLQGTKVQTHFYQTNFGQIQYDNIFMNLCKHGADVNIVYPEERYKPAFKDEEVDESEQYSSKKPYMATPIINLVRSYPELNNVMKDNIMGLIHYGAKFNISDSDGRDVMTYAVINDDEDLVRLLINNNMQGHLNLNNRDKLGKTPVHYVVTPTKFGSYENVKILKILHTALYPMDIKDNDNKAPIFYAQQQESGVLMNALIDFLKINRQQIQQFQRSQSIIYSKNWHECKVNYEEDSDKFMEEAKQKEEEEFKNKKNKIPVDKTGNFESSYEVYYDEEGKPWDVYLTKVDLKNGIYGEYVFYKMQLLFDTNRDLYVVFTRWGRIGETGMNQRTPFVNVNEAKTEYKKIFKQKTGGNNFEELETFARQKKKYNLTKVNYITVDFKDYLAPFDFEKVPKSKLPKPVYELFEEVSNVVMYQRAMSQFGVDTNVLPFSGIKRESLIQARQLLMEIKDKLDEDIELSKAGIKADYDQLAKIKEELSELSSRYYELVPLERYKNQIAPPLNNQHLIKTQFDNLEGLSNIEFASKILLGALYRQLEMNPVDYVFDALNLKIDALDKESDEFEVINKYISNTRNQDYQDHYHEIGNIFRLQRKGEAEVLQQYKDAPNHFLLYHGSQMFNFIGILSQGLRIAPPEAPPTGYMFGKGVYFADMFDKSAQYSQRGYNQQDSYLMLMCEVVLGKSKELYQAHFVEKLEHEYLSVKGVGRRGPSYKHTITLPNGVKIPYGPMTDYFANDLNKQRQMHLQHNEYIVYNTNQIRMRYLVQINKKKDQMRR